MNTHPIIGQVAPIELLGRATLEAINANAGCSIPQVLADINTRALALPVQPTGSLHLTKREIVDLAKFAGLTVAEDFDQNDELLMDEEFVVCDCPPDGVRNEGEPSDPDSVSHYKLLVYCAEYPEEGCFGLGPEIEPPIRAAGEGDLWCMHIHGPDDVHAAPSKAEAECAAAWFNERFVPESERTGVMCKAVVVPWPHSPESHAESVKDWAEQWTIPTPPAGAAQVGEHVATLHDLLACFRAWEPQVRVLGDVRADAAAAATEEAIAALRQPSFQERVAPWMQQCFGEAIARDVQERGDRFLEESLELLQSHGYDRSRVATLVDYVYGRPAGEPAQEVGGVMVTLAAYCLATRIDMHDAGERELARIWTKVDVIRAKQASKRGLHGPLPVPPTAALTVSDDDTKRLDWLALHPRGADIVVDGQAKPCVFWGISAAPEWTLRQAIDAAMAASKAVRP